jgi:hypothetical protein
VSPHAARRVSRREQLQLECALQRQRLALQAEQLGSQLQWVDRALGAVRRVSPLMAAAGVALSLAARAGGVIRLLNGALPLLASLRRLWRRH